MTIRTADPRRARMARPAKRLAGISLLPMAWVLAATQAQASTAETADAGGTGTDVANAGSLATAAAARRMRPDEWEPVVRPARLPLPVTFKGRRLLPVVAEVTTRELNSVDAASLAEALRPHVTPEVIAAIEARGSAPVTPRELAALGISLSYDPASLGLVVDLAQSAQPAQSFDFSPEFAFGSGEVVTPSDVSLGVTGTLQGSRDFSNGANADRLLYDFAGFANFGGTDGVYLTFGGTFNLRGGSDRTFRRDRITLFKDFPDDVLRIAAGDLVPRVPLIAGDAEILGVTLERRYDALQPLRNIRPTGRRSFTVDRPTRIEIYANGALVQTIDALPGQVDLNQIPAFSLSSNISIIVEDTTGRRELDSFTLVNDIELLGAGFSEFGFSAGVLRRGNGLNLSYSDNPVATGEYARGITDALTLGGHFILAEDYQNVGMRAAALGFGGAFFTGVSFSNQDDLQGYAASFAYRGDPLRLSELDSQFNFRADYNSRNYRPLSQFQILDTVKFDLAADYRINLTNRVAVVAGGNYFERYNSDETARSVFAGVQLSIGRALGSFTARYSRFGDQTDRGVLFTLTMPLGRNHFSNASYDTGSEQARFEFRRIRDITVPEVDYGVIAETGPLGDRFTGQARFANSRFNLDIEAVSNQPSLASGGRDQNIGQFRLQSGFAFADGSFGIGRNPARGFIMVDRHPSLGEAQIDVENSGAGRRAGQANGLGPAVIPQLGGYRPDIIRVDPINVPTGYDVGAGEYVSYPGAASGVKITIGSDAFRAALVTLVQPDGTPVALQSGSVRNLETGATESVFTNRAGRALFSNLAPGRYVAEFPDAGASYEFVVTSEDPVFIDRGQQTARIAP